MDYKSLFVINCVDHHLNEVLCLVLRLLLIDPSVRQCPILCHSPLIGCLLKLLKGVHSADDVVSVCSELVLCNHYWVDRIICRRQQLDRVKVARFERRDVLCNACKRKY